MSNFYISAMFLKTLKPKTAAAEDGLRSVNSTPKRANVESGARAKPPAEEIITSSRDSIAVTKTIGVYLKGEATTRSRQESTVATRTQPTNGVGDDWPPLTPSIDQATVVVARQRMLRGVEVGAYQYSRRVKPKGFYYPAQSLDSKKSGPVGTKAHISCKTVFYFILGGEDSWVLSHLILFISCTA